jgi:HlyD family secretion protein
MRRDRTILLATTLALSAAGCNRQPPAGAVPAPAAHPVTVVRPEMRPVHRSVEQPGAVQAFEETALFAKIPGFVGAVADDPEKLERIKTDPTWPKHDRSVDIGSRVRKDQLLAELRIPDLEKELVEKKARVRQAEAEVVQAEKTHAAAKASVTAATEGVGEAEAGVARAQALYDRWQSELTRITGLVKGGVVDNQVLDETQNQLRAVDAARGEVAARVRSARAGVTKAEADREKVAADIGAAKARLDVSLAEVGRVEAVLGYTRITAPFDGVVTRRAVNTGDLVAGGDKAALFSVARIDPVRVVLQVSEAEAGLVEVGQDVTLTIQGMPGPPATGKVRRTSWSLAPGSRTLRAEVDLPNPKGLARPGMYAFAKLTVELPAAWAVPATAVGKVGDEAVVYLVENEKAIRVTVQPLRGDSRFTQLRAFKRPGATDWTPFTGAESIATPAAAVTDGQQVR